MLPRKLVLFLIGLAGTPALQAAAEFPDGLVPMEVVREFAGGTVYRGLPDGFPQVSLPAGTDLRLIASTSSTYRQKLLLRTSLGRDALFEQLKLALTAQGWLDIGDSGPVPRLTLCHDQHGSLDVTFSSGASGGSRVDVTRTFFPVSSTCSEQRIQSVGSTAWYNFYAERLPVLEVPPGTLNAIPGAGFLASHYSSGGGVEASRDGNIEVPSTSTSAIHTHFAAQLEQQGWHVDSSGAGARSANSTWIKTVAAPGLSDTSVDMLATLTVLRGVDDVYRVGFKLQSTPGLRLPLGAFSTSTF